MYIIVFQGTKIFLMHDQCKRVYIVNTLVGNVKKRVVRSKIFTCDDASIVVSSDEQRVVKILNKALEGNRFKNYAFLGRYGVDFKFVKSEIGSANYNSRHYQL